MEEKNITEVVEEVVEEKQVEISEEKQTEASEDKHQKFYRITENRIRNAAKHISLIGNCASSEYEYSEEDVEKMFSYLQQALDDAKFKYEKRETPLFNWN